MIRMTETSLKQLSETTKMITKEDQIKTLKTFVTIIRLKSVISNG